MNTDISKKIASLLAAFLTFSGTVLAQESAASNRADDAQDKSVVNLDAFVVSTTKDNGYLATNAASATRINAVIQDTPMAITVMTEQFMKDMGAVDLSSALQYQAGVIADSGNNPGTRMKGDSSYNIRGLPGYAVFRDGFSAYGVVDSANIQRVEVVKGPASVYYGNASPGGLVNVVTKQPNTVLGGSILFRADQNGYKRGELDYNQPLNAAKTILFRIDGSVVEASKTFRRFENSHERFIAPSVSWRIQPQTTLSASLECLRAKDNSPSAIPEQLVSGNMYSLYRVVPRNWNDNGNNPGGTRSMVTSTAILDHAFSRSVSTRLAFNYWANKGTESKWSGGAIQGATTMMTVAPVWTHGVDTRYFIRNDWLVAFDTGPLKNKFVFGWDHSADDNYVIQNKAAARKNYFDAALFNSYPDSLFSLPVYSPDLYNNPNTNFKPSSIGHSINKTIAGYFSDVFSAFNDRLDGMVGGRYDNIRFTDKIVGTDGKQSKFSPQASLLYKLTRNVGVYASYSTSLTPNGLSVDGKVYAPETGKGREAGFKLDLHDHLLVGTFSVFSIDRTNVPVTVYVPQPSGVALATSQVTGEQRSQGFDMDWVISPTKDLQFVASYANFAAKIVTGNTGAKPGDPSPNQGQPVGNAPRQSGSLWGKYSFSHGVLKGLHVGLGASYTAGKVTKSTNAPGYLYYAQEWAPGYTRVDANVDYTFKLFGNKTTIGLNIQNITNAVAIVQAPANNVFLAPTTYVGTFAYKF